MTLETMTRDGVECRRVVTGSVELLVAASVGPRILGFRLVDGPQLFASLPGLGIETAPYRRYSFYGGHRLWAAPEVPATTYAPDDRPVAVVSDPRGISILAPVDAAGLEKSLSLAVRGNAVIVSHTIVNTNPDPIAMAAWAITQLATGGTAIMPLGTRRADELRPDRSLVAWPYTSWDDAMMKVGERYVTIEAARHDPLKIGTALRREWLAYRLHDHLFVKRAAYPAEAALTDLGATGQCYCNHAFLELETLGPLRLVTPGAAVTHREVWEIHEVPSHLPVPRLAETLDLDRPSPLLDTVV